MADSAGALIGLVDVEAGLPQERVRAAVGNAAKRNDWFKQSHSGELLGTIAVNDPDVAECGHRILRITGKGWG